MFVCVGGREVAFKELFGIYYIHHMPPCPRAFSTIWSMLNKKDFTYIICLTVHLISVHGCYTSILDAKLQTQPVEKVLC